MSTPEKPVPDNAPENAAIPTLDTRLDTDTAYSTSQLMLAPIGSSGQAHYTRRFAAFDAKDRAGLGWNPMAALLGLGWMLYRGLWRTALIYVSVLITAAILALGIGRLAYHMDDADLVTMVGAIVFVAHLLTGLSADAMLYWRTRRQLQTALQATQTLAQAHAWLLAQAPSRKRLYAVCATLLACAAGIAAAVWWASSSDTGAMAEPAPTPSPPTEPAPTPATPPAEPTLQPVTPPAQPEPTPSVLTTAPAPTPAPAPEKTVDAPPKTETAQPEAKPESKPANEEPKPKPKPKEKPKVAEKNASGDEPTARMSKAAIAARKKLLQQESKR